MNQDKKNRKLLCFCPTDLGEKLRTVPMLGLLGPCWARWPGSSCFRSHTATVLGTWGAPYSAARKGWMVLRF